MGRCRTKRRSRKKLQLKSTNSSGVVGTIGWVDRDDALPRAVRHHNRVHRRADHERNKTKSASQKRPFKKGLVHLYKASIQQTGVILRSQSGDQRTFRLLPTSRTPRLG